MEQNADGGHTVDNYQGSVVTILLWGFDGNTLVIGGLDYIVLCFAPKKQTNKKIPAVKGTYCKSI